MRYGPVGRAATSYLPSSPVARVRTPTRPAMVTCAPGTGAPVLASETIPSTLPTGIGVGGDGVGTAHPVVADNPTITMIVQIILKVFMLMILLPSCQFQRVGGDSTELPAPWRACAMPASAFHLTHSEGAWRFCPCPEDSAESSRALIPHIRNVVPARRN